MADDIAPEPADEPRGFFAELKRRKVYRVAAGYAVVAWLLIQAASIMLPAFNAPLWVLRVLIAAAILFFPVAVVLAWAFEITSEGIKRTSDVSGQPSARRSRRKVAAIIAALAVIAATLFALRFVPNWTHSTPAPVKSIAVLPFVNASGDPAQEFFSDGLSEELISSLTHIPELRVIGRNSSFRFKGKIEDARAVGEALGVANLLEGSVRKAGDRVRISIALVNAADGSQRWSQSYDRELKHIFALQEEIARSVADQLRITLLGQQIRSNAEPSNQSVEAFHAYLKGEFHFAQFNLEGTLRSIELYQEAIRLDPNYAKAYGALAWSYCRLGYLTGAKGTDAFTEARAAAKKALALNPDIALARSALGYVHMNLDWDLAAAELVLNEALQRVPRDATIKNTRATLLTYQRRREESLASRREAVDIDPLNVIILGNLSADYRSLRRFDEAESAARKAVALQPGSAQTHYLFSRIHLARGRADEALREAQLEPAAIFQRLGLALAHAGRRDAAAADEALRVLIENHASDNPFRIAQVYAYRGEPEKMFEWLERAYRERDPRVINTTSDDLLEPYHNDPRFVAFCAKIGLRL